MKRIETPYLDKFISDLETYDRMDMLSDSGRNNLNEFRMIKQVLSANDVAGRSEKLVCDCEYPNIDSDDKPLPSCKDCFKPMV